MTRTELEKARASWPGSKVTSGQLVSIVYTPNIQLIATLTGPIPEVVARVTKATIMQQDGEVDPELVGETILPEVTLSPEEFKEIPGALDFWHAILLRVQPPAP